MPEAFNSYINALDKFYPICRYEVKGVVIRNAVSLQETKTLIEKPPTRFP